ncbi:MAG: efflux RND transporter periplasmic adaptor subunit [Fimbriimonadales bacterium]
MKGRKRLILFFVVLVFVGAVVWITNRRQVPEVIVTEVRRGTLEAPFRAEGEIKGWEASLSVPMPAQVVAIAVQEGQTVSQGQVLVRFRDREALAGIEAARARLTSAQSTVREVQSALLQARQQADTALRYAQALYKEAQANLRLVSKGTPPEELARAEREMDSAIAQRDLARQNYERARRLYEAGALPRAELEHAESAYRSAEAQVQSLEAALQALKREPRPEILQSAQAKLEVAQAELERARTLQRTVEQMRERLRQAQAMELEARANLEQALTVHQNQQLTAPRTARVKRIAVEPGESVNPGEPIVELVNPQALWVEAELDQEDVGKIRVGDTVDITAPALPGITWQGRATAVSPALELKPTLGVRVRILRVQVAMIDPPPHLRVGMEVEIAGRGSLQHNALLVPSSAIIEEPNQSWVYVVREGIVHRQPVRTGYFTYALTEVVEGLSEGDLVVVEGKQALSEGQPVRVRRAP